MAKKFIGWNLILKNLKKVNKLVDWGRRVELITNVWIALKVARVTEWINGKSRNLIKYFPGILSPGKCFLIS